MRISGMRLSLRPSRKSHARHRGGGLLALLFLSYYHEKVSGRGRKSGERRDVRSAGRR